MLALGACNNEPTERTDTTVEELTAAATTPAEARPTVQEAREFLDSAEAEIVESNRVGARAAGVRARSVSLRLSR